MTYVLEVVAIVIIVNRSRDESASQRRVCNIINDDVIDLKD